MAPNSLPSLSINLALSADGKISSPSGKASGWTSEADFARLKQLREKADALLVGRGTLESDRMTLRAPQNPLRCVVSRQGRFSSSHPLFQSQGGPIHLLGTETPPEPVGDATLHHSDLPTFLSELAAEHGVGHVHCEGGGQLIHELAALDLIDEIHLTWAGHTFFGGTKSPGATGLPGDFLPASRHLKLTHFEPREDLGECFLTYQRV